MEPADSIEKYGFQRWYERQLIQGHAWLLVGILCLTAAMLCAGELRFDAPLPLQVALAAGILATGLAGSHALIRYLTLLAGALKLGEHATCRACGTYARFSMVSPSRARCRKCAQEWRLIG